MTNKLDNNKISFFLLFVFCLLSILSGPSVFICATFFLIIEIIFNINKFKRINSILIFPYFPFLFIGLLTTLLFWGKANILDIEKGIFGILNFLVFLLLGRALSVVYNSKIFFKTTMYFGLIYSVYEIMVLSENLSTMVNINAIRLTINGTPLFLVFILVLVMNDRILFRTTNRVENYIFTFFLSIAVIFTFSRTSYIYFVLLILIFLILSFNLRMTNHSIKILMFYFMLALLFLALIPQDIKNNFLNKVVNSISEISSQNDWNSENSVVSDWRGFENFSALTQFKSYDLTHKIFGEGLGAGIYVGNYAYLVGITNSLYIPYLHNSFYTILLKMGMIGFLYYALYFVVNIGYLLQKIKENIFYLLPIGLLVGVLLSSLFTQGGIVVGHDSLLLIFLGFSSNRQMYDEI